MNKQDIEILIQGLTFVQMYLQDKRRDHNGNVLVHWDIDQLQESIKILQNIEMDLDELSPCCGASIVKGRCFDCKENI